MTLACIWVTTLWRASLDDGDAVLHAVLNLTVFTAIVGAIYWFLRRRRRKPPAH